MSRVSGPSAKSRRRAVPPGPEPPRRVLDVGCRVIAGPVAATPVIPACPVMPALHTLSVSNKNPSAELLTPEWRPYSPLWFWVTSNRPSSIGCCGKSLK